MKKRLLSLLLAFCMVFTMIPVEVFATQSNKPTGIISIQDENLCKNHKEHNKDCGFVKAVEAIPAKAEITCNKDCTPTDDNGKTNHVEGCAYAPAVAEVPAIEGAPCNHVHDDTCGVSSESGGKVCTCEQPLTENDVHTNPECPLYTEQPKIDNETIFYLAPPVEDLTEETVKLDENGVVSSLQPAKFAARTVTPIGAMYEYASAQSHNMGVGILSTQTQAEDITAVVNIPQLSSISRNNVVNVLVSTFTNVKFSVSINGKIPENAKDLTADADVSMSLTIPVNLSQLKQGENSIRIVFEGDTQQMLSLKDVYILTDGGPKYGSITNAFDLQNYNSQTKEMQLYSKVSDFTGAAAFQYYTPESTDKKKFSLAVTDDFVYAQAIKTYAINQLVLYNDTNRVSGYIAKKFQLVSDSLLPFEIKNDVVPQTVGGTTQQITVILNKIFPGIEDIVVTSLPLITWADNDNNTYTANWPIETDPIVYITYSLDGQTKQYTYNGVTATLDLTPPQLSLKKDVALVLGSTQDKLAEALKKSIVSYYDGKNPTPNEITFDTTGVVLTAVGDYTVTVTAKDGMENVITPKPTITVHVNNVSPVLSATVVTPNNEDTTTTKSFSQTVQDFGTGTVTSYGFVVGYNPQPTLENQVFSAKTDGKPDSNTFTANIAGLKAHVQYYVRTYLTIDNVTTYSEPTPFSCGKPYNYGMITAKDVALTHDGVSTTGKIVVTRPSDSEGSISADYVLDTSKGGSKNIALQKGTLRFAEGEFEKEISFNIADGDEFTGYRSFDVTFSNFAPTTFNDKTDTATISVVYNTRKVGVLIAGERCLLESTNFHYYTQLGKLNYVGSGGVVNAPVSWETDPNPTTYLVTRADNTSKFENNGYVISAMAFINNLRSLKYTIKVQGIRDYRGYSVAANILDSGETGQKIVFTQKDSNQKVISEFTIDSFNKSKSAIGDFCWLKGIDEDTGEWVQGSINYENVNSETTVTIDPKASTLEVTFSAPDFQAAYPTIIAFKALTWDSYSYDTNKTYFEGDIVYLKPTFNSKIEAPAKDSFIEVNGKKCVYDAKNGGYAYTLATTDSKQKYTVSDKNTYYILGKANSDKTAEKRNIPKDAKIDMPTVSPDDTIAIAIPKTEISGKPSYKLTGLLLKLDKENVLNTLYGKIDNLPEANNITNAGANGKSLDEIVDDVSIIKSDISTILAAGLKQQDIDNERLEKLNNINDAIEQLINTEVKRLKDVIASLPETLVGAPQTEIDAVKALRTEIQGLPICVQKALNSADKAKIDNLLVDHIKLRKVILDSTTLKVLAPDLLTMLPIDTVDGRDIDDLARVDVILNVLESKLSNESLAYMNDLLSSTQKIGVMLDISLLKRAVDEGISGTDIAQFEEAIEQLDTPITISLTLPKEMQNGSNFVVLSHHSEDDFATAIPVTISGGRISFLASAFSDYAIAYTPYTSSGGDEYCTITASAGKGGNISTGEYVSVRKGDSAGFTFTPNKGYKIADVLVNGKSVGAVKTYIFTNVYSNQTIHVKFKASGSHLNPQTGVTLESVAEKK